MNPTYVIVTDLNLRYGILPRIRLGTLLLVMSKISTLLTSPRMAVLLHQVAAIVLSVSGISKPDST